MVPHVFEYDENGEILMCKSYEGSSSQEDWNDSDNSNDSDDSDDSDDDPSEIENMFRKFLVIKIQKIF